MLYAGNKGMDYTCRLAWFCLMLYIVQSQFPFSLFLINDVDVSYGFLSCFKLETTSLS